MSKKILVCGAGGFIGTHLVKSLSDQGHYVIGADLKYPDFSETEADVFLIGDLRDYGFVNQVIENDADELYQLAADMGGAGYIFTGLNDANVMHNSAQINLNVAKIAVDKNVKALFYSSSACMYPEYNQLDPNNPKCAEDTAYPASPDSEYGWEKLFSERLYLSFKRNYGLNVKTVYLTKFECPDYRRSNCLKTGLVCVPISAFYCSFVIACSSAFERLGNTDAD